MALRPSPLGWVSDTLGFGAARWGTGLQPAALQPAPGRIPVRHHGHISGRYVWDRCCDPAQDTGAVQVAALAPRGAAGCSACSAGDAGVCAWCPELGPIAGRMPGTPWVYPGTELEPGRVQGAVLERLFFMQGQSILLMKQPVSHLRLRLAR